MAIRIEAGRKVRLAYRLIDGDGRLLEERTPEAPYEYEHGGGQLLEAVERALEGKTAGFRAEVTVLPNESYGEYDPSLAVELPRSHFPAGAEIDVGMKFSTVGPSGKPVTVRVTEVDGDMISIDGNHPLAGLELIFDVRVLEVSEGGPAADAEDARVTSQSSAQSSPATIEVTTGGRGPKGRRMH